MRKGIGPSSTVTCLESIDKCVSGRLSSFRQVLNVLRWLNSCWCASGHVRRCLGTGRAATLSWIDQCDSSARARSALKHWHIRSFFATLKSLRTGSGSLIQAALRLHLLQIPYAGSALESQTASNGPGLLLISSRGAACARDFSCSRNASRAGPSVPSLLNLPHGLPRRQPTRVPIFLPVPRRCASLQTASPSQ